MPYQSLSRALVALGRRQDLVLVVLIVAAIMMMILPLPTWIVDVMIAVNMAFTVLLLMVAIYLRRPVDIPVLPAIILIATVFRLALSITTTRLILLQADAGRIIETFGNFVVAGNLVVGLVIFLIITVVQFVVITKGAERVAEVGARFTLDAIPGKQMSIDAEQRNGDISKDEARQRRSLLERESQLYGAMDGAMKFVKGDAIAGLVIIAINLLGGMIIGTLQLGFTLGEAAQIYSLLTVGDGLVAQIPALFVSIAASAVVTRVHHEDSVNLGADISAHLLRDIQPLELAAAVVFLLGFVPGFPTMIFAVLAAIFIALALVRRFGRRGDAQGATPASVPKLVAVCPVRLRLAPGVVAGWPLDELRSWFGARLDRLSSELGLPLPAPEVAADAAVHDLVVEIDEVPVARAALPKISADGAEGSRRPVSPAPRQRLPLTGRMERRDPQDDPALVAAAAVLEEAVRRHVAMLTGLEQTKQVLDAARQTDATLVDEALRHLPVPKFCLLFRQMLAEGLTLRHHRCILETVVTLAADGSDIPALTDHVRAGLKRQLSHMHCAADGRIHAVLLPPHLEEALQAALRARPQDSFRALSAEHTRTIVDFVTRSTRTDEAADSAVVLTAFDLRRHLRGLLMQHNIKRAVLSYEEIAPGFELKQLPVMRPEGAAFGRQQPQAVPAQ